MCGYFWLRVDFQKKEAFGYDLFLEKRVRGQGFGRQIMERGKELLRCLGINKVKLCVFENNAPARGLYLSLGFREIRRVDSKGQIELETVF
jgi:ribosomal protein S18 acetylase RimI-like enzyme